jgi:predicted RNase H-like HicB family nuclease
MRSFTAVVERDPDKGATLDELRDNLREVVATLLEDGDPRPEAEFIGTQSIAV